MNLARVLTLLQALAVMIAVGPTAAVILGEWWPVVIGFTYFAFTALALAAAGAVQEARSDKAEREARAARQGRVKRDGLVDREGLVEFARRASALSQVRQQQAQTRDDEK